MKTAVAHTSIANYHSHVVPDLQGKQESRILAYVSRFGESTIGEIAHALDMEKSTVSARQNKLRADGLLEFGAARKCSVSGITCNPLRLPAV